MNDSTRPVTTSSTTSSYSPSDEEDDIYDPLGNASIRNPKMFSDERKKGVIVFCRVRPPNKKEKMKGENIVKVGKDLKNLDIETIGRTLNFQFDRIFDDSISQEQVYEETAKPIVSDVLNGYNVSLLAYGQTGSGKTYTTFGPGFEFKRKEDSPTTPRLSIQQQHQQQFREFVNNEEGWGIIPRLMKDIFIEINKCGLDEEYRIIASFIEIYMEKIRDLLNPKQNNLTILQDLKKGLYITQAEEVQVFCCEDVMKLLKRGIENRFVAETNCNTDSSRSHAIFVLTIYKRNHLSKETKCSQLYLSDLAGSERVSKTKAQNLRLDEAKKINASLLSLRQVIFALSENEEIRKRNRKIKRLRDKRKKMKKERFVPYRNSKLTRILQNSLGGNAYCIMLLAISPSSYNQTETISTLRFGEQSLHIQNEVKQNKHRTAEELEELLTQRNQRIEEQSALIRNLQIQLKQVQKMKRILSSSSSSSSSNHGNNDHSFSSFFQQKMDLNHFYSFFICPISQKIMTNPYFAMDGFTYNKGDLIKYLNNPEHKMKSPVTQNRLISKQIVPNHTVKAQIEYFSDLYPMIFEDFVNQQNFLLENENFIPNDILFCIFMFLNASDVMNVSKVCRQWYTVSKNETIWKNLWFKKNGFPTIKKEKKEEEKEKEEEEEGKGEGEEEEEKEEEEEGEEEEKEKEEIHSEKTFRELFFEKFLTKDKTKTKWNLKEKEMDHSVYLFSND